MDKVELGMIMKTCVILHDIIVKDECDLYDLAYEYDDVRTTSRNLMPYRTIIRAM